MPTYRLGNCSCCGCSTTAVLYHNTTDLNDFFAAFNYTTEDGTVIYPYAGCTTPGTPIALETRLDPDSVCNTGLTICNSGALLGPVTQVFTPDGSQTMDLCAEHGFKVVHANRKWNGRYGFVDDYVANPKIESRFRRYVVDMGYSESYSATFFQIGPGGTETASGAGANAIGAGSENTVEHWGVPECLAGLVNYANSAGHWSDNLVGSFNYYWPQPAAGGGYGSEFSLLRLQDTSHLDAGTAAPIIGGYKASAKAWCNVDADRGVLRMTTPWGTFQGNPTDLSGWLAQFAIHTNTSETVTDPTHGLCTETQFFQRGIAVSNFEMTNTRIRATLIAEETYLVERTRQSDSVLVLKKEGVKFQGIYTVAANLSGENKWADVRSDAKTLLAEWNMADDVQYPWRTDSHCNVAPLVSRREREGSAPLPGFCEPPATAYAIAQLAAQKAFYDGSIVGAPMDNGYYDPGYFDQYAIIYDYRENLSEPGKLTLCYEYGAFMPSYLPTTATQFTTGAKDKCFRGGAWEPYSRYKVSYILPQMPPFVWAGGAFVAGSNASEVWVSKYAEIKEPLPSQNFVAPMGKHPNQCATDNHAGWTCAATRDLVIKDANCNDTADKRYPEAWPIAGKAAITANVDNLDGTVTITAATPDVRVGDVLELIDASKSILTSLTVTAATGASFTYTGSRYATAAFAITRNTVNVIDWVDFRPRGDFLFHSYTSSLVMTNVNGNWQQDYSYAYQVSPENVRPIGNKRAVIALVPPGSPELTDIRWPSTRTNIRTAYHDVAPMESWAATIIQGISDRFWIPAQDQQQSDGLICEPNDQVTPLVEARLGAPLGAPLPFNFASANRWFAMPKAEDLVGWSCSNVWNYGAMKQAYADKFPEPSAVNGLGNQPEASAGTDLGAGDDAGAGGNW